MCLENNFAKMKLQVLVTKTGSEVWGVQTNTKLNHLWYAKEDEVDNNFSQIRVILLIGPGKPRSVCDGNGELSGRLLKFETKNRIC